MPRCSSPQLESPRGVGVYIFSLSFRERSELQSFRIVEFASQEDSQRSIRELSEQPLLGRPVFIREVRSNFLLLDLDLFVNK